MSTDHQCGLHRGLPKNVFPTKITGVGYNEGSGLLGVGYTGESGLTSVGYTDESRLPGVAYRGESLVQPSCLQMLLKEQFLKKSYCEC